MSGTVSWLLVPALAGMLAVSGWLLLFSTFAPYDDEGYVLISLRHFSQIGALYDRVYTQYGPFFFVVADALSRLLAFDWNSSTGRLLALVCWLGSAGVAAALVARRTGSLAATAFCLAATFAYLIHDIYEPGHPGSLIALLVAGAAWLGSEWDVAERPWAAAAIGAIGAALLLTKVNVGGLLLIAATAWFVVRTRWRPAVGLALVVLPWAVTWPLLANGSVRQLAANTTLGALGAVVAVRSTPRPRSGGRAFLALVLSAVCVSSITVGLVLGRGTTLPGLLAGVVTDPLHHPVAGFLPVRWWPGVVPAAVGALLLTLVASRRPRSIPVAYAVVLTRALAAIALAGVALVAPRDLAMVGLAYGVGVAGLCAVPTRFDAGDPPSTRARQWLALVLVLQSLHAFPTAGSQVSWGTFLFVPLLTLAVHDAWSGLARERGTPLARSTSLLVVGTSAGIAACLLTTGLAQYRRGDLLGLPGAEKISLPVETASTLRTLVENARAHADVLFSQRGMFSFNAWADRPTPTLANGTLWWGLLKPDAQRAIVARLRDEPRAVVIRESKVEAHGELSDYVERDFEPAFVIDGYAFLVHRGRRIAPLSTARMYAPEPGWVTLTLTLAPPGRPISWIEVRDVTSATARLLFRISAGTATLAATPMGEDGTTSGRRRQVDWPAVLESPVTRLEARFRGDVPEGRTRIAFLFSDDGRLGTAEILP